MRPKIALVYFDAGGGHRAAAHALRQVIEQQQRPWDIQMVHLQEVLDPLDVFRKLTGLRLQDVYNLLLKKGWTLGSPQLTRGMHLIIRLYHARQVRLLREFWRANPAEMVVSLVPNFNRAIRQSLPGAPFVTILTDLADYPPHFWIERQEQFLICGSDQAMEQARQLGHPEEHLFRVSGMILNPRFYAVPEVDRTAERRRLGLDPERATGLLLFGGEGSMKMLDIARRLASTQLIAICGHNAKLAEKLRALPRQVPLFVEGFTREVPYYMQLADFVVGKPGPGSISEALQMKLPVIVECNAWTLPQERYNARWVVENQVGLALGSFRGIDKAVAELLRTDNYQRFRAHASAIRNRAVFEIPDVLESILTRRSRVS